MSPGGSTGPVTKPCRYATNRPRLAPDIAVARHQLASRQFGMEVLMLRNLAWHATDALTRAQLSMMHALADGLGLTPDDRRQALNLTGPQWQVWTDFLADGPLPPEPALPEMLRRLAQAAFDLSLRAERVGVSA
jgi:hypothetical protein